MTVPLSVLDLAAVAADGSHSQALADTLTVAGEADRLGYRRFWVAEHHGMPGIASSAPPVLIAAVAAATERIRVGSGGVMLPNHSSLVVAEQFGTLVALHGDRIDLGLGRAAGTDPLISSTIRRGAAAEAVEDFPKQVVELMAYFGVIPPLRGGQGDRIRAIPGHGDAPQLWLLGSSDFSARLAAMLGLPFAFAHHFAGGRTTPLVFELYRREFTPSAVLSEPHSMVAVATVVADSAAEARRRTLPQNLVQLRMRTGQLPQRIPTLAEAEAYQWSDAENAFVDDRNAQQAVGTLDQVRARIDELVADTGADEVIVAPQGPTVTDRLHTLRALAELPD
ncbi:alkanal monooxygenase [Nocardia donostiensis]|uniref:LLM class flavin-dependent oxidoreductase n=1 Tax=Nocardia donostiensis TaxID=1538463 RepID=UPI0009DB2727|nr:LLM class flavin-dependent oxidoreductase [Nocardia donostiensis]OQS14584.1 alkanal monooxygenase [Nocardia donostiensis]